MKIRALHTIYVGAGRESRPLPAGTEVDIKDVGLSVDEAEGLRALGFVSVIEAKPDEAKPAKKPAKATPEDAE